ncbi:high affinity immunoglobulin epsilon receptor subunit alpha-like [Acipenser ruthenus]|uniref:high affinity immunoglobulin epsilon receptor subunit alpha-like n=1 Tax=Acipenser ruthenus TaxID=7906 RepID=UPI0027422A4C|nr:high affinity immunoglobulin epsilon receptor subunit alpha-like [Acipenser ruthenus]
MCPNPILFSVLEGYPKAVLTLQPAWAQIFRGETVTLGCEVEGGSAGWRFKQYRDGREEAGCSDQYSRRYGDSCTISNAQNSHSGEYWCESASGQERSNAVNLTVSNQWVILQTPPQPVIEGDSLTLRCRVWDYTATRVDFYKENEVLQSQAGTELSVDHVSKSDEGSYKCRAEWRWDSSPYSDDSAEVRVSVRGRHRYTVAKALTSAGSCSRPVTSLHSGRPVHASRVSCRRVSVPLEMAPGTTAIHALSPPPPPKRKRNQSELSNGPVVPF